MSSTNRDPDKPQGLSSMRVHYAHESLQATEVACYATVKLAEYDKSIYV